MPLHGEDWASLVSNAFYSFVVGIYEPAVKRRFADAVNVDSVAVVLCGDVAAVSLQIKGGLVLASVPELELVGVTAL